LRRLRATRRLRRNPLSRASRPRPVRSFGAILSSARTTKSDLLEESQTRMPPRKHIGESYFVLSKDFQTRSEISSRSSIFSLPVTAVMPRIPYSYAANSLIDVCFAWLCFLNPCVVSPVVRRVGHEAADASRSAQPTAAAAYVIRKSHS
jgi:hypothetical protein